jgi:hypothetical protein
LSEITEVEMPHSGSAFNRITEFITKLEKITDPECPPEPPK